MSREPDWDTKAPEELAIMRTISLRACATYLNEIRILLGGITGLLAVIVAKMQGWI